MRRTLEQQAQNHARPALPQQGEGLGKALIALPRLVAWLTGHSVSVARLSYYFRNLQKVSL